ncbi:MAG: hypothetical protein KDK50_02630 [Chlamydiia bacterium]|nr:hypothetical protein [Chlamydiia bacterium]
MDDKQVCIALATTLDQFINDIRALLKDQALAEKKDHLSRIANEVFELNKRSLEVIKSEDVEDVAVIVQDILTQPINGTGKKQPTSMLQSAEAFQNQAEDTFKAVMHNFIRYNFATVNLIKELELLSDELKKYAA